MQIGAARNHRWGVILAGGEGVRLRSLTRLVSGDDTPKQFCPLLNGRTLLTQTKDRLARRIAPEQTRFVLLKSHERFYTKDLHGVPKSRLITQPANRGTLPAILCSLIDVARADPDAVVGFFPSDHYYADEDKFLDGIDLAFEAAESDPDSVILLGAPAQSAEVEYGWIEAEPATRDGLMRVKRFWEKPSAQTAKDLLERGCVWNTFVMVGRAEAFLDLIRACAPDVYREFERTLEQPEAAWDAAALTAVYERLRPTDFSKDVLSVAPERLGLSCLGDVGWSDLGDPRRVVRVLSDTGVKHDWMTQWQDVSSGLAVSHI
jgi:mannose-1-phosphate guanylyltransferase